MEALRQRAASHRRSLNAEAVHVLSEAARARRSLDEVLTSIRENAAAMGLFGSDADAEALIEAGRNERDARILGT